MNPPILCQFLLSIWKTKKKSQPLDYKNLLEIKVDGGIDAELLISISDLILIFVLIFLCEQMQGRLHTNVRLFKLWCFFNWCKVIYWSCVNTEGLPQSFFNENNDEAMLSEESKSWGKKLEKAWS